MKKQELSSKQKQFATEYMVDSNCTKAAIRAGYSKKTAHSQGSRLLKKVEIRALVDKHLEDSLTRAEITADQVNEVLAGMIMTDATELFEEGPDGTMIPRRHEELSPRQRSSIKEVTLMTGADGSGFQKITQHDRLRAIDLFYKRTGEYTDGTINNFAIGHVTQLQLEANRRRAGLPLERDDE